MRSQSIPVVCNLLNLAHDALLLIRLDHLAAVLTVVEQACANSSSEAPGFLASAAQIACSLLAKWLPATCGICNGFASSVDWLMDTSGKDDARGSSMSPEKRICLVHNRAKMPDATTTRSTRKPYNTHGLIDASLVPVTLLTSCRNNMALPTMKSRLANIEYKIPFTLSSVRKAASAKANVGPGLAAMASAWHHAQAAAKVALPAMSAPFCKKSAAETMTPNASNGSEVMATNLKMKDIRPAYKYRRINE